MSANNTAARSYGTANEIAFLDSLGKNPARAALLRNYIAAADRRAVWNEIDKTAVLLYALQLLDEAEATSRLAA